jgi:amidase
MVQEHVQTFGPGARDQFKPEILWHADLGARLTAVELARAESLRSRLFDRMTEFMTRYDFLVLPTVQVLPFAVEQRWVDEIDGTAMPTYMEWMRSCWAISTTGNPAISVPAAFVEGLPFGIQIVGRTRADRSVLEMAYGFEQAAGNVWKTRPQLAG